MHTASNLRTISVRTLVSLSSTAALALCPVAAADGALGDIWISSVGGTLVTGGFDHATGAVLNPSQRVFAAEFGVDPTFPFSTDEPGFTSDLLGSFVSVNLLQGLGRWNGGGFDAAASSLFASYAGQDSTSVSGGSFGFLVTAGLDLHPEFTLVDPLDGVYLASFTADAAGYATSATFHVVFNLGAGETEHDAAIAWAEANLVPAPGALALLAAAAIRRRRR